MCRIPGYSREIPLAPKMVREVRESSNRLVDVVELADAELLGAQAHSVLATPEVKGKQRASGEIDGHPRELGLGELESADRTAELLALTRVLQCGLERAAGGAHRAPKDAVARLIQAGQRADEAARLGKHRVVRQTYPVQDQLTGNRRPQ